MIGAALGFLIYCSSNVGLFVTMIEYGIYGFLSGLVIGLILLYSKKREENAQKALAEQEYLRAKAQDQRRVCAEKKQAEHLIAVKNEVQKKQKHTQALLREYYDKGALYTTYQNITAVCSIYEYLESGKCSQLHGHEGAYVLYDQERRLDRIIEGLDRISNQIEQIRQNQVMLYSVAQEMNNKLIYLSREMNEQVKLLQFNAEQNSIIAYHSAITAKELHMSNWLKSYELDKAGILPQARGTSRKLL